MFEEFTWRRSASPPRERSGAAVAGLSLATIGVYYAYWVHRLHVETPARVGVDPATRWAVAIPIFVALVSIVPILASGAAGDGEVNLWLFSGGMALNFVAHLIYLWLTLKLTDRLIGVAESAGLHTEGLTRGKRDLSLGVASLLIENVGLKSVSFLELDVPPIVDRLDGMLLVFGMIGLWNWSRGCLIVANAHALSRSFFTRALSIAPTFATDHAPGVLGLAPSELSRAEQRSTQLIRPAIWMIEDDDESGFGWFLESEEELMKNGVVVPGTIVQANLNLFEEGGSDHPGELLFSLSDDVSTDELLALSSKLYDLKGEDASDANEALLAAHFADEMERAQGLEVPSSISSIPQTYVSTALVYRDHLPQARVASGIYPVLVSPNTRVAMILPMELWTQEGYEIYRQTGGHEVA